jgi:tRNA(Ile)-lysidine synthase
LPAIVWSDYALRRYRQRVFLTGAEPPRLEGTRNWRVAPGSHLDLRPNSGTLRWAAQIGGLDAQRLPESVTVRRRSGGEALKPGVKAKTRSVQHLCQSLGVLPWMRDALPLVFADDALVAVGDLWLDARWCVAAGEPGFGVAWDGGPNIV